MSLTPRRLLFAIFVIGLFVLSAQPALDSDLWWHLRTGQWILDQQSVPHSDPFSATMPGVHWVAHEWLADVALYALYQLGGLTALTLAASCVITLTFVCVYRLSALRPHIAVFTTLLAALASAVTWGPRPQMLTMLFAALTLLIVQRAKRTTTRVLWLLPPLFIVWANVHSGFFLGLVILGAAWAGEALAHLTISARGVRFVTPLSAMVKGLTLTLIASTLACLLNPNGAELLIYPFFTLTSKAMQTYIVEWHSPDFHDPRFLPFALLWFGTLITFALSRKRPDATDLILLLGLGYESFVSIRNIPLFAIVAAPLITRQLESWFAPADNPVVAPRPLPKAMGRLNALLLIIIIIAAGVRVANAVSVDPQLAKQFPVEAANYLTANQPKGPLLNSYNFGGYLIWRLFPTYRVFIDGRADVYGDAFMDEYYARAWQGRGDWQSYLDRYHIQLVVMETDGALASLLRAQPQWRVLHSDSLATIFERAP